MGPIRNELTPEVFKSVHSDILARIVLTGGSMRCPWWDGVLTSAREQGKAQRKKATITLESSVYVFLCILKIIKERSV